jgi:CUE domain
MSSHEAAEASLQLNVPQLAILLIVGILAFRWIFSSQTAAQAPNAARPARGARVDVRQVDAVAQMFPQLNRRDIMWDLQRNGNNIQMTIERLLTGRGLEIVS